MFIEDLVSFRSLCMLTNSIIYEERQYKCGTRKVNLRDKIIIMLFKPHNVCFSFRGK